MSAVADHSVGNSDRYFGNSASSSRVVVRRAGPANPIVYSFLFAPMTAGTAMLYAARLSADDTQPQPNGDLCSTTTLAITVPPVDMAGFVEEGWGA